MCIRDRACATEGTEDERINLATKRIWLEEFNPEWINERPLSRDPEGSVFPLVVIDSDKHHIHQTNSQHKPGGDVSVWLGLDIPEHFAGKQVSRHQINARRYATNRIGKVITEVALAAAERDAFRDIERFATTGNLEHDWEAQGRYIWWGYSLSWGWN